MKIFTMVKGENDIVEDWVKYHGNIFGYNNIYVIDNYSKDGTYQILVRLKQKYNINITRLENYKKKGIYMTNMLKTFCKNELAFPIDIDEFIVYYDKNSNKIICDKHVILSYITTLPKLPYYKMNYVMSKMLVEGGYQRASVESKYGTYIDCKTSAKTFFNSKLFKGIIDHGNHYHTSKYYLSNLCLVHFHLRNLDQMKKKIYNNVRGLGYTPFNIKNLEYLLKKNPDIDGHHHIKNQISILNNTFNLPIESISENDISLQPLNDEILKINE